MKTKKYTHDDLTIIWKPEACIHSEACWRNLGSVFKPKERPWINPEGSDKGQIIAQVNKCPSGALSYELSNESKSERIMDAKKLKIIPNGPIMIEGNCEITLANGEVVSKENRVTLCRCGASANKPFCDGAHKGSFAVDS